MNAERCADSPNGCQPLTSVHTSCIRPIAVLQTLITRLLPARRYASAGTSYGPVSVCVRHKSVFYRNGRTNRVGLGMGVSFHLTYTVKQKLGYLQN